jgi:hypothetical protein
MIAKRFDLQARKTLIDCFDFLEADDIGLRFLQPGHKDVDAGPDAVDVPRHDFHMVGILFVDCVRPAILLASLDSFDKSSVERELLPDFCPL